MNQSQCNHQQQKTLRTLAFNSSLFITRKARVSFSSTSIKPLCNRHLSRRQTYYHLSTPITASLGANNSNDNDENDANNSNNTSSQDSELWAEALEGLLEEALRTYYQGTPLFSDAEFNTLRDELEHLGLAQIRLANMEKIWVQATSSRDFDRRLKEEFNLSEEDLRILKNRLLMKELVSRPLSDGSGSSSSSSSNMSMLPNQKQQQKDNDETDDFVADAEELTAIEDVNERIKWFLFSDASEERFKIMLLYLPAVVMSFVTASVLTILFALLDGEMQIYVTAAGRFRLGILSYVVVMLTFWFSNQVTPTMMDYLDLGQPTLMRGSCPICGASVSCLFTGAARIRDERKCSVCGASIGFNRRWSKTYLVSPPGRKAESPD